MFTFLYMNKNKIKVSPFYLLVYTKVQVECFLIIETDRRGARPFSLFVQSNSPDVSNLRDGRVLMRRRQDRSFVFKLFDIFKHLRGFKSVDEIKNYRRDYLGNVHSPWP